MKTAKWIKQGLVYSPVDRNRWMSSHAQMPIVHRVIGGEKLEIIFTTRDQQNRSLPVSCEMDLKNPGKISNLTLDPFLTLGKPGCFDDAGVMPSCFIDYGGVRYLYYIGWNGASNVPFRNAIGLAVSEDGGKSYRKFSNGPLLDRSVESPYYVSTPFVRIENGTWKMWFMSGLDWHFSSEEKPRSFYNIRYAESKDGVRWQIFPEVALDFIHGHECAIARPWVSKNNGKYQMWFCSRWDFYSIGYAESIDGYRWIRKEFELGLSVSENGWDCKMVAYPYLYTHEEETFLFYNGNSFGQTGIGFAKLEGKLGE